ncbi:sigma-70 family RNA polymerase sigma factor [Streptomyces sp. GZWMJZ-114]|uniref:sigma-70 family RNA polymerase sigma factor n=1 Tax=unclassified Streptomyces TaxID=2593676 RepID=UPI0013E9855E|nr:sigma-70 family RNA polymerase sigma factor [Streptomyces sp. GZWMJZ-114]
MRETGHSGPGAGTVRAARAGDTAALDRLLAESLPLVYNVVGRALNGHSDVDDVVQETLLRVVRALPQLRDEHAYRSWLMAIAVRRIRDRERALRAAGQHLADWESAAEVPDPAADFVGLTVLRLGLTDQRREIAEATRWLDGDDRALLALWWLEETGELERAELAEALGVSRRHAAVRVQRMKEQVETARTVVHALARRGECAELDGLLGGWDGTPSPLWRKRIARHVRGCARCGDGGRLLPMERLLAGLPLLPLPAAHAPHLLGYGAGSASAPPHTPTGHPSPAAPAAGPRTAPPSPRRGGAHRGPRTAARLFHGPVGIGAAAAAVAAAVATPFLLGGGEEPAGESVRAATAPRSAPDTPVPSTTSPSPSPSPSHSAKPSPSPRTTTKKSPAPVRQAAPSRAPGTAVVASARKGVGVWDAPGDEQGLAASGARWYYTWSASPRGIVDSGAPGFVPMIWGEKNTDDATLATARANGPYLLGFNEPDMGGQANLSVERALDLWPKLMAHGKVLGSPAVAYGGDTPGGWLDRFMTGARERGYRVDFVAVHWYGGDFRTEAAVQQLRTYLEAVHRRYGKPVWLTEFALTDFSQGVRFPAPAEQAAFLSSATRMLDTLPWLQRYAWFGLPSAAGEANTGLYRPDGSWTEAGQAFRTAR